MKVSRSQVKSGIHFICIDNREKQKDGSVNIILDNGQKLLLPPNISEVPSLLLLHHGNRVVSGLQEILKHLQPGEQQANDIATSQNGEPLAFSMGEMGSGLSDNYSYLDMTAEELSAKGNGGLRIPHSYMLIDQQENIATPPEDYVPNKIGTVDMGKIEQARAADINRQKKA